MFCHALHCCCYSGVLNKKKKLSETKLLSLLLFLSNKNITQDTHTHTSKNVFEKDNKTEKVDYKICALLPSDFETISEIYNSLFTWLIQIVKFSFLSSKREMKKNLSIVETNFIRAKYFSFNIERMGGGKIKHSRRGEKGFVDLMSIKS
jgi:hypothetical protein